MTSSITESGIFGRFVSLANEFTLFRDPIVSSMVKSGQSEPKSSLSVTP